jgi:hypothetical protein
MRELLISRWFRVMVTYKETEKYVVEYLSTHQASPINMTKEEISQEIRRTFNVFDVVLDNG